MIDYWPTTGKAWVTGSSDSAVFREPDEAMEMALTSSGVVDGEVAESHMQAILEEDPPWTT